MGWGNSNNKKKKSSPSSSSSRTSIIARVFPVSWFSKRKQKSGGQCEDGLVKREKLDFSTAKGRFYSMDGDEAYWRLSFADEKVEGGRRSTGGINPLWCDSDEEFHVPVSEFKSFGSGDTRSRNFSDMVMEIKKTKEQNSLCRSKKVDGVEVTNHAYDRRSRRVRAKEPDHGVDTSAKTPEEKVIFEIKPEQKVQRQADVWKSPVSNSRKKIHTSPVHAFEAMDGEKENVIPKRVLVSETKNLKELKGIKVKTESQSRKVVKQRSRVKAYSPRTECKIRALEEMRKARMLKLKKAAKEQPVEGSSIFDSFAVVKSSFDPYHDFRDSMVEMIIEKGIISSEDLEELLACYLTLNRDEYHDLIIQVFRQVWLDLNKDVC